MPLIHIKTHRLEYRFEIHGKYTVIQGDSATGKSTFYDLVTVMFRNPAAVQNLSGVSLIPMGINATGDDLVKYEGNILVLDEDCHLFKEPDIASKFKASDNYFIFINRDAKTLGYLPIHVDNVFCMKTSGKFHTLDRIYDRYTINKINSVDVIITEDMRSGYLFLKDMLASYHLENILLEPAYGNEKDRIKNSAAGASKIVRSIQYHIDCGKKDIFVIYDASAFGAYIGLFQEVFNSNNSAHIYVLDWDSFEGYILGSKVYNEHYTLADLDYHTESLEQFMTHKLSARLNNYNKAALHKCLRSDRCKQCMDATGCKYRLFSYEELIYDGIQKLKKSQH